MGKINNKYDIGGSGSGTYLRAFTNSDLIFISKAVRVLEVHHGLGIEFPNVIVYDKDNIAMPLTIGWVLVYSVDKDRIKLVFPSPMSGTLHVRVGR